MPIGTRTLTNYELTEQVKKLQRQVCCCTVNCDEVDLCLGISPEGSATLFLNEQGNWVAVPADSNFATTDLTFTGNRVHDAVTFGFNINGVTGGGVTWSLAVSNTGQYQFTTDLGTDTLTELVTPTAHTTTAVDGTNTGIVSIEPETIDINSTDGGDTSSIQVQPASITLNATGDYYIGDQAGANLPPQEAATWDLGLDANGKVVIQDATNESIEHIGATFDGGGSELVPNDPTTTWYAYVGYDCTITAVTLFADQTGDIEVDVWVTPFASYPPVIGDSITAAAIPTISGGIVDQDTTLTGWTVAIPADSFVGFSVLSVTDITRVSITLTVVKD